MPNSLLDIALVLFTRNPEEEVRVKKFVPQGSAAQQLAVAEKLVQNGRQLLATTGLPYYIYSSAAQKGNNFGERLQNAFADFFDQGYNRVIVIGNDCPQLKPADILQAADKLCQQEVVVGPDTSGGVYLLGLTREAFTQKAAFGTIRWNTTWVLTDIAATFGIAPADLSFLEKYSDLNNRQAFTKALRLKLFRPALLRFFRQLFGHFTSPVYYQERFLLLHFYSRSLSFRGPPSLN